MRLKLLKHCQDIHSNFQVTPLAGARLSNDMALPSQSYNTSKHIAHVPVCRVMDVIMADKMDQALLKAAVALLKRCEPQLLQMHDMEDALHLLKLELPGRGWLGGGVWVLDHVTCWQMLMCAGTTLWLAVHAKQHSGSCVLLPGPLPGSCSPI